MKVYVRSIVIGADTQKKWVCFIRQHKSHVTMKTYTNPTRASIERCLFVHKFFYDYAIGK